MQPKWINWARQLQAIAQTGLTYAEDPFDIERYAAVREIAAEIMAEYSGADISFVRDLFAAEVGHATPKIDIRGGVFRDGRILLVRERADGLWTLPGGWVDIDEPPSKAIEREIREESGFETRAVKLAALYDRNLHDHLPFPHHVYKLHFLCELVGGAASTSIETSDVAFFAADDIPALSTMRVTSGQIARLFAHYRHPELPADFD